MKVLRAKAKPSEVPPVPTVGGAGGDSGNPPAPSASPPADTPPKTDHPLARRINWGKRKED